MLHIFITNRIGDAVAGYEAKIVGGDMAELPRGSVGRLAVRGPTGCRYLADKRQTDYVCDAWNLTGDTFMQDADADAERGQIVTAYIVLRAGVTVDTDSVKRLRGHHLKAVIAPYKYPRAVNFIGALPKIQTGKVQRFKLRT
jgi:2-aminobenzoate-CoA ligase